MASLSDRELWQVWPEATPLRVFIQNRSGTVLTGIIGDYFSALRQKIDQVVEDLEATEKRLTTEVTSLQEMLLQYSQRLENTRDVVT